MRLPDIQQARQKWNNKYRGADVPERPSRVLTRLKEWLVPGRAIDVAGGAGRNAIWLAEQELDVTLADLSTVGLELARQRAKAKGIALQGMEADLEAGSFPQGPWDLVFIHLFLWRPILAEAAAELRPGGRLIMVQPTQSNLERHEKPPADFLLGDAELPGLVQAAGLRILHEEAGWLEDGRHEAVVVAERPL